MTELFARPSLAMLNDESFNDTLTYDIVSFEQLGPGICLALRSTWRGRRNRLLCFYLICGLCVS